MARFDIDIGGTGEAAAGTEKLSDSLWKLNGTFGDIGNSITKFAQHVAKIAEEFGPAAAAAYVLVTALIAVAGALEQAMEMAVEFSQQQDALRDTFDALGSGAGAGEATLAMVDKLSKELPVAEGKLQQWAKSMMAAGLQGAELEKALRAVAAATAIMGESGGHAAESLIKRFAEAAATGAKVKIDRRLLNQLAEAGVSAEALAQSLGVPVDKLNKMSVDATKLGNAFKDALVNKGAASLNQMSLTWSSIWGKVKEAFEDIFKDLGPVVEPFMEAVKSLFGEFNKGKPMMEGFKAIAKSVFTVLFTVAKHVVDWIHLGLLKLYIGWLKIKIAIAPVTNALGQLFTSSRVIWLIEGIIKMVAFAFGLLLLAASPVIAAFAAIVAVGMLLWSVISAIVGAIGQAIAWLFGLGAAALSAGANFVKGLIDGILSGIGGAVGAVKNLGGSILGALKGVLGIASRSKLTYKIAGHLTEGVTDGLDDGKRDVQRAAAGTGAAAAGGVMQGAAGAANGAGGGSTFNITIEKGAITIQGAGGDIFSLTEEMVALVFERVALREGLG